MTNKEKALAWIAPALDDWCGEWSFNTRREFSDKLAAALCACVKAKGVYCASYLGGTLANSHPHLADAYTHAAHNLLSYAADVPEPPR